MEHRLQGAERGQAVEVVQGRIAGHVVQREGEVARHTPGEIGGNIEPHQIARHDQRGITELPGVQEGLLHGAAQILAVPLVLHDEAVAQEDVGAPGLPGAHLANGLLEGVVLAGRVARRGRFAQQGAQVAPVLLIGGDLCGAGRQGVPLGRELAGVHDPAR